jgi:alanyl-tRNA synthetase
MLTAADLRQKYIDFFKSKGHAHIPSAPVVPENDPTVLFTTAGMHPLVPYLMGQPHPLGKRLVDFQKCVRTDDIEEVGDATHHTFFEMLGNWSLGDYFKKEAITWSYEFLSQVLKLDMDRIFVTCFSGDADAPKDEESARIWESLGIPSNHIFFLGKKDNWWGPAGTTGPCGPDTEMHFDSTKTPCSSDCKPGDDCGRFCEIWNDVFMQYNKTSEGKFEKLSSPCVDTGMGLERTTAILNGLTDNYLTDLWQPTIQAIEQLSNINYTSQPRPMRIIADHLRAAVFIVADGVTPSNKGQGYILRRLIRRSAIQLRKLNLDPQKSSQEIVATIVKNMSKPYPGFSSTDFRPIFQEISRFQSTLDKGLKEFSKLDSISGKLAFDLFQTYGFPLELTAELAKDKNLRFDVDEFKTEFARHQDLSRTASKGMFKGGLQDHSEITTKYHTATHLLHAALRQILGTGVQQKGSNITAERLRFDFSHPDKLTPGQLSQVESLVNQKISENILVTKTEMKKSDALSQGALAFFPEKYPDITNVYQIGDFSKELCGGPHVASTGVIGGIKIVREESAGSGVRRIYAQLAN